MTPTQVSPEEHVIMRLKCPRCESVDIENVLFSTVDDSFVSTYRCNKCGDSFNIQGADLRRMLASEAEIKPIVFDTFIHELDLNLRISDVGVTNQGLLEMLHSCIAVLTCEDSSPKELFEAGLDMLGWFNSSVEQRCELAAMMEAYIETKVGKVHWLRRACVEGECDICNERDNHD